MSDDRGLIARIRARGLDRSTLADGATGFVVEIVSLVVTVISFTLLGRRLGPTEYGGFIAVYGLVSVLMCIAYLGPGLAFVQTAMRSGVKEVAGHFFAEQLVLTTASAVVVVLLAPVIVPRVGLVTVVSFLVAEFAGVALVMLASNLRLIVEGYRATLRLQLLPQFVKLGVLVALAVSGRLTLANYGVCYMIGMVSAGVVAFGRVTHRLQIDRKLQPIQADHLKTTVSIASTIFAWGLHNDGDKLVLSANKLGPDLGLYAAAYKLVQFGVLPVNAIVNSSFRSFVDPGVGRQTRRAIKMTAVVTAYTTVAAVLVIAFAPFVLPILVGPGFHQSIAIARWLAPLLILRGMVTLPGNALLGMGHVHWRLTAYLGSAAVGMTVYLTLIPSLSWKGAVIGSYVSDSVLVITIWTMLFVATRRSVAADSLAPIPEVARIEAAPLEAAPVDAVPVDAVAVDALVSSPPRIVLMGDEPNSVEVISRLLRRAGYDLDVVGSWEELDRAIGMPDVAAVMIDVTDPNSRGLRRLVRAINERDEGDARGPSFPILVTASDPTAARWAPTELGVNVVLQRPFKGDALLESLGRLTSVSDRSIGR